MVLAIMAVGMPFTSLASSKAACNLAKIIAVRHIDHVEIKRLKFLIDRIGRTYLFNCTVDLKAVIIYNHNQIIQLT